MTCCGRKMEQVSRIPLAYKNTEYAKSISIKQFSPTRNTEAHFKYIGTTGLTVMGPVTGKRYRFSMPGAIVAVDLRDRPSLTTVPKIKQVISRCREIADRHKVLGFSKKRNQKNIKFQWLKKTNT